MFKLSLPWSTFPRTLLYRGLKKVSGIDSFWWCWFFIWFCTSFEGSFACVIREGLDVNPLQVHLVEVLLLLYFEELSSCSRIMSGIFWQEHMGMLIFHNSSVVFVPTDFWLLIQELMVAGESFVSLTLQGLRDGPGMKKKLLVHDSVSKTFRTIYYWVDIRFSHQNH